MTRYSWRQRCGRPSSFASAPPWQSVPPPQAKRLEAYKLYLADTGLFVTMMFNSEDQASLDIYAKLLSDGLPANLGYLYENFVAQTIAAQGRGLFYHTWTPEGKSHAHEVDFLVTERAKVVAIEVKSSSANSHASIDEFARMYSPVLSRRILFSQKDASHEGMLELKPLYLAPVVLEGLSRDIG